MEDRDLEQGGTRRVQVVSVDGLDVGRGVLRLGGTTPREPALEEGDIVGIQGERAKDGILPALYAEDGVMDMRRPDGLGRVDVDARIGD